MQRGKEASSTRSFTECTRSFSRVEERRGAALRSPFPLPAHRTGRADFPHPALRLASSRACGERRHQRHECLRPALASRHSLLGKLPELRGALQACAKSPTVAFFNKHTRSQGPFLHRRYPASSVLRPSPTPARADVLRHRSGRYPRPARASPACAIPCLDVPCPLPRWTGPGASVGCFPRSCCLPRTPGGSASTTSLSRPAQASFALRPVESLARPRRTPASAGAGFCRRASIQPIAQLSRLPATGPTDHCPGGTCTHKVIAPFEAHRSFTEKIR